MNTPDLHTAPADLPRNPTALPAPTMMDDDPPAMSPAQIIASRTILGMTQTRLAAALGVTQRSVLRWEKGESRPHTNNIRAIAKLVAAHNQRRSVHHADSIQP